MVPEKAECGPNSTETRPKSAGVGRDSPQLPRNGNGASAIDSAPAMVAAQHGVSGPCQPCASTVAPPPGGVLERCRCHGWQRVTLPDARRGRRGGLAAARGAVAGCVIADVGLKRRVAEGVSSRPLSGEGRKGMVELEGMGSQSSLRRRLWEDSTPMFLCGLSLARAFSSSSCNEFWAIQLADSG